MCIASGTSRVSPAAPGCFFQPPVGAAVQALASATPLQAELSRLRSSPARSALGENRRGEKRSIWRKGLWGAVARNFASILVAANAGEPRMA